MRSLFDDVEGFDTNELIGLTMRVPDGEATKEAFKVLADIPSPNLGCFLVNPATWGETAGYKIDVIIRDKHGINLLSRLKDVIKSDVKGELIDLINSPKFNEVVGYAIEKDVLIVDLISKLKKAGASEIMMPSFEAIYERDGMWWIRYAGSDGKIVSVSSESTNFEDAQALLIQRKQSI